MEYIKLYKMFPLVHVAIVRGYTQDHVSLCVFPDDDYVYQSKHVAITVTQIYINDFNMNE
jgi:hypothetical protein